MNGSSVLRDSGVCGAHGTCENVDVGKFKCKCDKEHTGNHCHISKFMYLEVEFKFICMRSHLFFSCDGKIDSDVEMISSIEIDHCKNHTCKNGASCLDGNGNYTCVCTDGWEGDFCEKGI